MPWPGASERIDTRCIVLHFRAFVNCFFRKQDATGIVIFLTNLYIEFHTFGVLRAENGYFFYVDRKLSAIVPYYQYAPCPVPGRMELTVEAADWAGAGTPECLAQLPAQMLTDYVRVWDSMPDLNQ